MNNIMVFGAGNIGTALAMYLTKFNFVYVVDEKIALEKLEERLVPTPVKNVIRVKMDNIRTLDFEDFKTAVCIIIREKDSEFVISALPYFRNEALTIVCANNGITYLDLGGNDDTVQKQLQFNAAASVNNSKIIPDCGLAPGLANVMAMRLYLTTPETHTVEKITMRVGGLPNFVPDNEFKYARTWSTEGLINEYVKPCRVLEDGLVKMIPALEDEDTVNFKSMTPPADLESFPTSGGASTLPTDLAGKVKNVDYRTIRFEGSVYPLITLKGLGFFNEENRGHTAKILNNVIPTTDTDIVLIQVTIETARPKFGSTTRTLEVVILPEDGLTAMQRATALPTVALAELLSQDINTWYGARTMHNAIDPELLLARLEHKGIVITEYKDEFATHI